MEQVQVQVQVQAQAQAQTHRIYGFLVGATLGDIIGNVVYLLNQTGDPQIVTSPLDANKIDYPVGIWTEPTAALIQYINTDDPDKLSDNFSKMINHGYNTCNGIYCSTISSSHNHGPEPLWYIGTTSLRYYNDFHTCLKSVYRDYSILTGQKCDHCAQATKLWASLIDFALHGLNKSQILTPYGYVNLSLAETLQDCFDLNQPIHQLGEVKSIEDYIRYILHVFKNTESYVDGMVMAINYCSDPVTAGALYGQLAGAYYGVTDIPEYWIEIINNKARINNSINKLMTVT